jgi:hypothetical protein
MLAGISCRTRDGIFRVRVYCPVARRLDEALCPPPTITTAAVTNSNLQFARFILQAAKESSSLNSPADLNLPAMWMIVGPAPFC